MVSCDAQKYKWEMHGLFLGFGGKCGNPNLYGDMGHTAQQLVVISVVPNAVSYLWKTGAP